MKLSDTEWTVMNAVWQEHPASARDVLERVESRTGWAYSTVKTTLARLVEKGALAVRMRANTGRYEPLITRGQARRSALRNILDRAFDGTVGSLVQHLISEEKLSARERAKLAQVLAEADKAEGKS